MCWFVTMGVTSANAPALEALNRVRAGLKVAPATNPHVARLFPPRDRLYLVTHGGCSCDLHASAGAGHRRDASGLALFREAVSEQVRAGGVRLFATDYRGDVSTEAVTAAGRTRIDLTAFLTSGIPDDHLVEITPASSRVTARRRSPR